MVSGLINFFQSERASKKGRVIESVFCKRYVTYICVDAYGRYVYVYNVWSCTCMCVHEGTVGVRTSAWHLPPPTIF